MIGVRLMLTGMMLLGGCRGHCEHADEKQDGEPSAP